MTRQFDWLLADYYDAERPCPKWEHVTTPRPSCMAVHGARFRLSRMLIGDNVLFGAYLVRRVGTDHGRVKGYRVGEIKLTYAEVLAIVEGRARLPIPVQLPLEGFEAA